MEIIKFTVANDEGREMYFSGLLLDFLSQPINKKRFRIGKWLSSLSENDIERLGLLADLVDENSDAHLEYLSLVIMSIQEEEKQRIDISSDMDKQTADKLIMAINVLKLAVTLERFSRRNLVTIKSPISINPNKKHNILINENYVEYIRSHMRKFTH